MNIGNQKLQKKINSELIINILREQGNLSRSQIAERTKLGWGSITKYTAELLHKNIVKEMGEKRTQGRKSVILGLNPDYKYMIGLDIGSSNIKGVVVNMTGIIKGYHREPTLWDADQATVLNQIYAFIEKLLEISGISSNQLLTIGCGISAFVDFEAGRIIKAANFKDFSDIPIKDLITQRFNKQCYIANSMVVRLLGESKSQLVGTEKNVAYISLGTGIGAGIIYKGKVIAPTENEHIGDIAHFLAIKDGPSCYCGLKGCLEFTVGSRHLMHKIQARLPGSNSELNKLSVPLNWELVTEAAKHKDKLICDILREAGHYIGIAAVSIIQFYCSDVIILGGGMTNLGESLIQPIRDTVAELLPIERFNADNIIISKEKYYNGAIGATLYAWDNIFHSRRQYVNIQLNGTMQ